MILIKILIVLAQAILVLSGQLKKISSKGLNPYSSNKGEKAFYSFSFLPDNRIEQNGLIELIFPQDFEALAFPSNLECRIQSSDNSSYEIADCVLSKTRVIHIQVDQIPNSLITVIVGEITNPRFADTSSQFKIRTYRNDVLIDSNDVFGFLSFSEKPGSILKPNIYQLSNSRISEGSSWEFSFTPQKVYPPGSSLRFTFPEGFTSKQALCDVQGLYGVNPETVVLFNERIILCQNVNKELNGPQSVKIINMVNPNFSNIMQGFKIEILDGLSSVVLEQVTFPGNIEIQPGPLKIRVEQDDQFKWSTTTYSFFVNLINPVYLGDRLYLNFTSDWTIFSPNCTIINGFTAPFGEKVRCARVQDQNSYMIDNFVKIDNSRRLVFSVLLESPHVENQYPIQISTYNTKKSAIVDLNSVMVNINSTYGIIQRFTSHALKSPQVSKAGENGALELTFFLKTQLPKTNVGSQGKFRIDIFPQIPIPESKYGTLACYFYGDVPSKNDCKTSYRVDMGDRTYIYINTPELRSFKESEIPISVTTFSPLGTNKAGIKLDELIQRYKIHVNIWKELVDVSNPDLFLTPERIPDEVYFTEFVPESTKVTDGSITASADIANQDAYTYLNVKYIHNDNYIARYTLRDASVRNYVLRVYFINGFADDLGWGGLLTNPTDKTIRNYPCYLDGPLIDKTIPDNSGTGFSNCEIVFRDKQNTYLQVNNLKTKLFDNTDPVIGNPYVNIGIPKIKVGNLIGDQGVVSVRLVEETPNCWDQIVVLYQKENINVFTIKNPYTTVSSSLTINPIDTTRLNQKSKYQFDLDSTTDSNKAIIEWPVELAIQFGKLTCTTGTCIKFGYPVYWIVYTPSASPAGTSMQLILPDTVTFNYKHEKVITFGAQSWLAGGAQTIKKLSQKTFAFNPVTMTVTKFSCPTPADYKYQGLIQKHEIEFTLEEPVPDGWFIDLKLIDSVTKLDSNKMIFDTTNENFFFKATNLVGLNTYGILTEKKSATNFWVYNLKGVAKGQKITLTISITMKDSAPSYAPITFIPSVYVRTEYNYPTLGQAVNVAYINHIDNSITLSDLGLSSFKVMNPISFRYEPIQGSVGPFHFQIQLDSQTLVAGNSLIFKFQQFVTAGTSDGFDWINSSQPFTCILNGFYHKCKATKPTAKFIEIEMVLYVAAPMSVLHSFEISSDITQPINGQYGLKFPTVSGYYGFEIWAKVSGASSILYYEPIFIRPPEFKDILITMAHRTPSVKNIFTFDMTFKDTVDAYSSGGRIRIYFPGFENGVTVFDQHLGHPSDLQNAACWFTSGFIAESSKKLMCSLGHVLSDGDWNMPFVEIMNFQSISGGTRVVMNVGNVKNPASTVKLGTFKIHTYKWVNSADINNFINAITETVVFDFPSGSPISLNNNVDITFEPGKKILDTNTYLEQIINVNVAINIGDLYITELPRDFSTSTSNQINLATCDSTVFDSCSAYDEGNFLVWKFKKNYSANTSINARININQLPSFAYPTDTQFKSYIVSGNKATHMITNTIKSTEWAKIVDAITLNISTAEHNSADCVQQKYIFSLTFTNAIPAGGVILIKPTSGISSGDLKPKCFMIEDVSYLSFNDFGIYGSIINCSIQFNGYYITAFKPIAAGSKLKIQAYSDRNSNPGSVSFTAYSKRQIDTTDFPPTGLLDQGSKSASTSNTYNNCALNSLSYSYSLSIINIIPFSDKQTIWQFNIQNQDTILKTDVISFTLVDSSSGYDFYATTTITPAPQYDSFHLPADFFVSGGSIGGNCLYQIKTSKDDADRIVCSNFNANIGASSNIEVYLRIKNPSFSTFNYQYVQFYTFNRSSYPNISNYKQDAVTVQPTGSLSLKIQTVNISRSSSAPATNSRDLTIPSVTTNQSDCLPSAYPYPQCHLFQDDLIVLMTSLKEFAASNLIGQLINSSSSAPVGTFKSLQGCGAVIGKMTDQVKVSQNVKIGSIVNNPALYYFANELYYIQYIYRASDNKFITQTGSISNVRASQTATTTVMNSGYVNNESRFIGKYVFKINRPTPQSSTVILTVTSAKTQLQFGNKVSASIASANYSPLLIVPIDTNKFQIIGLPDITVSTDITIYCGLRSLTSGTVSLSYLSTDSEEGRTIEEVSGSFSSSSVTKLSSSQYSGKYRYMRNISSGSVKAPLQFAFQLRKSDVLYSDSTRKIVLTIPSQIQASTGGKSLSDYQEIDITQWLHGTPSQVVNGSGDTDYTVQIGQISSVQNFDHTKSYYVTLNTRYATGYDGFQYPANIGYYKFTIKSYQGTTLKEYSHDLIAIEAETDSKLQVTALNTHVGHETVINFRWQVNVAAASGDELWLEFQTNNGRPNSITDFEKVFHEMLGDLNQLHKYFECIEATNNVITTTNVLTCELFRKGDKTKKITTENEVLAGIRIPISNSIAAGTWIEFYVSGIKNPQYENRDVRITISLRKTIVGYEDAPMLAYQRSHGIYYTTTNVGNRVDLNPGTGWPFTYNVNAPVINLPGGIEKTTTFSATGSVHDGDGLNSVPQASMTHTWNIITESGLTVNTNDWIKVIYTLDNNPIMGSTCKVLTDANPRCVFPTSGFAIAKYKGAPGNEISMTVDGMQNGIYRYAGDFYVEQWNGSDGATVTAYKVAGLTYEWDENPEFQLSFQPTMTPMESQYMNTYWLTDFMNVVEIKITKLWKYYNIKSFWLEVPKEITYVQQSFCNATLTVSVAQMKPYPKRFNCKIITDHLVAFELTNDFDPWLQANNYNNPMLLTFKFWIDEFVKDGPTSDFILSTSHLPIHDVNPDYGVTRTKGNINISPYIQPDLRIVTFNSLRFYERKAIVRDQVEFYMLLQPKTALALHRVENILFRLPEEFLYAPIRYLDACDVQGKFNTPVLSCELMRIYGKTYVNMTFYPSDPSQPNYNKDKLPYDNTVKIVRISSTKNSDLFTAPELPGEIYNITASLYSRNQIIEKQTINITKILGYKLVSTDSVGTVMSQFQPIQDSDQLGLFQMRLKLDKVGVIAGYDTFAAKMYSKIVFIFDNIDYGYPQDLGTGIKNGQELGCTATGLTFLKTKKLTCILTYGFNTENQPYITVSGYDPIPANADVTVYITQILSVPQFNPGLAVPTNLVAIKGGIQYFYKDIGIPAFFYEPFEFLPPQTTPQALAAGDNSNTVTTSGLMNKVLEKESYTFTFKTANKIKQTDFIALKFPADYFERFSDYSQVTTNNFNTYVFGISNMIYISPLADLSAGSTVTAQIKNLINPAYSQNIPIIIQGFTMIDYKVKETFDFKLIREVLPFNKFTRVEAISSSRVGGANGISYKIVFITGHSVPSNGAFSITMPAEYTFSMYEMEAKCQLIGFDIQVTCMIGSQNRIDVFLNGYTVQIDKEYAIVVDNVNSPNVDVSSYKFTLTSYFSDNIYINQMICKEQFAFPSVTIQQKLSCDLVAETTILNANAYSLYTFMLQCENTVRPHTDLEIVLHEDYQQINGINKEIDCTSNEPQTLRNKKCQLELNGSFQYVLKIRINTIPSQSLFSVKAYLQNPKYPNKPYSFSSNLYSYSIFYAQSPENGIERAITFSSESKALTTKLSDSTKRQVTISNIPRNAGQSSTYILTIPPLGSSFKNISPNEIRITFPQDDFALTLGENLECGVYITQIDDKTFKTYKGLLSMIKKTSTSNQSNSYFNLKCRVVQPYELIVDADQLSSTQLIIDSSWQHWVIRNVFNPKLYNENTKFHVQYILNKQIIWNFNEHIVYYISTAPSFIKLRDLKTDTRELRTPSQYSFDLKAESPIPQNPIVGISILLPSALYDTIEYLESSPLKECSVTPVDSSIKSPTKQKLGCSVYDQEVLIEKANFQSLFGNSTSEIQIDLNKLFNPNIVYTCNSKNPDLNQYSFRFFDWNSGDLFLVSSPSIDTSNCMNFEKNSFDINFEGPLTVSPGLSYTYKLKLEQPAHGLRVIPQSPIAGIKFDPEIIELKNYADTEINLLVKIRTDVLPRTYLIEFKTEEDSSLSSNTNIQSSSSNNTTIRSSFYLPISPLRLNVQVPKNTGGSQQDTATVTVSDLSQFSLGYPIRVPVLLSKSPSNILMLTTTVLEQEYKNIIIVNPPQLQINPGEIETFFEIIINTSIVPSIPATLEFSLSSYYNIIHSLTSTKKYISFSKNNNFDARFAPLSINFSKIQTPTPKEDQESPVLNKGSLSNNDLYLIKQYTPKVILTSPVKIHANNATISLYASSTCQMYIALSYQGDPTPRSYQEIISKQYSSALQYLNLPIGTQYRNSGAVDHEAIFTFLNLEAQTNYALQIVLQNAFGYSEIFTYNFITTRLSFGSIISIPLSDLLSPTELIKALSLTLRISEDRFISNTNIANLQEQKSKFDKDIMSKPEYYYDIVITPDTKNDQIPTELLVNKLINDASTRSLFKSLLPSFNQNNKIRKTQIIQGIPTISEEIKPILIQYNNATFSIKLWEKGYVFAIVQQVSQENKSKPLSKQIFLGKNQSNKKIESYQTFGESTDDDGRVIIQFDDLQDGKDYILSITIGNHLPYPTLNLFDDEQVRQYTFSTPLNVNLENVQDRFKELEKANPQLASALLSYEF